MEEESAVAITRKTVKSTRVCMRARARVCVRVCVRVCLCAKG